ncbi:MAG TPA: hypothetical protein VMQ51_15185 [Candidatus Binatia bacterium]|nr:hypothetical protein [Candidatus Binatia bacterium]
MIKQLSLLTGALTLAAVSVAGAQYPVLDMVAGKVIQKYQTSTCEQLWEARGKPKSEEEQRIVGFLKSDPQMRTDFINRIAAPVVNKMFECGLVP